MHIYASTQKGKHTYAARLPNRFMIGGMTRDEHYIIDLCDRMLAQPALRQHRFDFLIGDPGKGGRCCRLPVDAWYPSRGLVIEYRSASTLKPCLSWTGA